MLFILYVNGIVTQHFGRYAEEVFAIHTFDGDRGTLNRYYSVYRNIPCDGVLEAYYFLAEIRGIHGMRLGYPVER